MRAALVVVIAGLVAGCATPVVMKNPASGDVVDCTARAAAAIPGVDPLWTGRGIPAPPDTAGGVVFDQVHRCIADLKANGWVCESGC
ncbi:MAG: hypothetical protein HY216_06380 [Candidatus Rokubacteria bacterium]|nr:hypothetical protein [Candidatus Rokubacteria bacterium]